MNNDEKKNKPLKPRELLFVQYFTSIGTKECAIGEKSAIKAGYSKASARTTAWKLLKRANIRQAIDKVHKQFMDKAMINPERILSDLDNVKQRALAKGDLASANRAIHLQGMYLTMFTEKLYVHNTGQDEAMTAAELAEAERLADLRLYEGREIG